MLQTKPTLWTDGGDASSLTSQPCILQADLLISSFGRVKDERLTLYFYLCISGINIKLECDSLLINKRNCCLLVLSSHLTPLKTPHLTFSLLTFPQAPPARVKCLDGY